MHEVITRPTLAPPQTQQPPMYAVLLHNDHSTHPLFVIAVLQEVFRLSATDATTVVMGVHLTGGPGLVLVAPKDVVETRTVAAHAVVGRARPNVDFAPRCTPNGQCELRFTVEPHSQGDKS
jgi:ATP-dependent Clp protease adaptor protein ClpS